MDNRPLAFQFRHLRFPLAAVPPLGRSANNQMKYHGKLLASCLFLAIAVFVVGRVNHPTLHVDRSFMRGLQMQSELRDLRSEIFENLDPSSSDGSRLERRIKSLEATLKMIVDEGRKRHYSHWVTDTLAVAILLSGTLMSVIVSWKVELGQLREIAALKKQNKSLLPTGSNPTTSNHNHLCRPAAE